MSKSVKRILSIAISTVLLFACAVPGFAASVDNSNSDRSLSMLKLKLEITSDKASYLPEETIVFTVNITNSGIAPIYGIKLVSFVDSSLLLASGSSSVVVGAIDGGNSASVTLTATSATYAVYEQESVNAVFSSFGQVYDVIKMLITFLFEPFMNNIETCNVNFDGKSQGILCLAYGFSAPGDELESEDPYVINNGEIDTDKDGLTDVLEKEYGTSITVTDTDGDGFSDYQEVMLTKTNPLVMDDPGEDTDGDGIIDYDEVFKYKTDINKTDSDEDGIGDYEEIFEYKTEPAVADTDEDGLTDGFEIAHNLNPNKERTNGVMLDGELEFEQTLSDKRINSELLSIYNVAKPGISGLAVGEMDVNVCVELCEDFLLVGNRAVIGMPVDVIAENNYVDGLTVFFDLEPDVDDLSSFVISTFDEDGNPVFLPTAKTGNRLSCTMTGDGIYFVIDTEVFEA